MTDQPRRPGAERRAAITIDGLAEVVLNVRDTGASLAFYRDLLGLTLLSPPEQRSPIFLRAGAATAELPALVVLVQLPADAPNPTPPRTLNHLALTLPGNAFDTGREALVAAGLAPRSGTHPILAARTMYVDDPDGNEVELIAPGR